MIRWVTTVFDIVAVPDFTIGAWRWLRRPIEKFVDRPVSESVGLLFEPVALLLALTYGFGPSIGQVMGIPYAVYVAPGVAVITALFVPYWETAFGVFGRFRTENFYGVAMQSPIRARDIAIGEIIWGAFKGTSAGFFVLIIASLLNWKESHGLFWTPIALFPAALASASLGVFFANRAKVVSTIMLVQGVVLAPIAFWSDTVFTLSQTSSIYSILVLASPITYVTRALRSIWIGQLNAEFFLYLTISFLVASLLTNIAIRDFEKTLEKK